MKEKKVTMKKTIKLMLGILALAIALPTGAYLYYNHVWRGGDVTYTQITSAGIEKPWTDSCRHRRFRICRRGGYADRRQGIS